MSVITVRAVSKSGQSMWAVSNSSGYKLSVGVVSEAANH